MPRFENMDVVGNEATSVLFVFTSRVDGVMYRAIQTLRSRVPSIRLSSLDNDAQRICENSEIFTSGENSSNSQLVPIHNTYETTLGWFDYVLPNCLFRHLYLKHIDYGCATKVSLIFDQTHRWRGYALEAGGGVMSVRYNERGFLAEVQLSHESFPDGNSGIVFFDCATGYTTHQFTKYVTTSDTSRPIFFMSDVLNYAKGLTGARFEEGATETRLPDLM